MRRGFRFRMCTGAGGRGVLRCWSNRAIRWAGSGWRGVDITTCLRSRVIGEVNLCRGSPIYHPTSSNVQCHFQGSKQPPASRRNRQRLYRLVSTLITHMQ